MVVMTGKVKLALALFTTTPYSTTNVYAFAILPLFIIMGLFAMHAGLSARRLTPHTNGWAVCLEGWPSPPPGPMPCSLRVPAPVSWPARCSLASACPRWTGRGYDQAFACGTIAAAGMLGMLIPPSALMIVYGILTEQSIGKLLIAGVGPGVLLTLIFTAGIIIVAIRNPGRAPRARLRSALLRAAKGHRGGCRHRNPGSGNHRRDVHGYISPPQRPEPPGLPGPWCWP